MIYIMYLNCMSDIMILARTVLQIFVHNVALLQKMPMSEKGDNSVNYLRNFAKSTSGHLHIGHNLWAKYHDPSSRSSRVIYVLYGLNAYVWKGKILTEFYEKLIRWSTLCI